MREEKISVALGTFDGLHVGHLSVIRRAGDGKYPPCVLLFSQHPQQLISGAAPPELLTARKRGELLRKLGVGSLTVDFAELMSMPPETFFYEALLKKYRAGELSCGENYTFGRGARGDVRLLERLCAESDIPLHVAPLVTEGGVPVSSTAVRRCIQGGEIERANRMLGRAFSYDFEVVSGDRLGRTLGFPTINQVFPEGFVRPKHGVYASAVRLSGKRYAAATNFGECPTVGAKSVRSETCILGFSGDLYGKNVEVELLSYLRPEIRFDSLKDLSEQVKRDLEQTRLRLTAFTPAK